MFEFIHEILEASPYDAYVIETKKKRGQLILIVEIEKAGYVNIEDCQMVSRLIQPLLEAHPEFKEALLEVASADPERELITLKQYHNAIGKTLKVTTGKETIEGTLEAVGPESITVKTKEASQEILLNTIKKTHLTIVF